MKMTNWNDLKHKASPEERESIKKEALAEYDRMGYAALRKARALTQVEVAKKLDISQGSVATLEARTDLHLSTLAKYIRALGGEMEIRAVFPEATFNLEPPLLHPGKRTPKAVAKRQRPRAAAKRIVAVAS